MRVNPHRDVTGPGGEGHEPVVHRGDVVIHTADDLRRFQDVTEIDGNLEVFLDGEKLALPSLEKVTGSVNLGNDREIDLPQLATVGGGLSFAGNPSLKSIALPRLETVGERVEVSSRSYPLSGLETLSLPALRKVGAFSTAASGLRKLSLPKLESAVEIAIRDSPRLEAIELPSLKTLRYRIDVGGDPRVPPEALKALKDRLRAAGVREAGIFIG